MIACEACGVVHDEATELLEEKEGNLRDLELQLRKARATISKLHKDQSEQQRASPWYNDAHAVFDYWKSQLAPKAREFNGERFSRVCDRLEGGHTVEELKRAIDGAKANPRPGGGTTDLLSICRNEPNLLMFMGWADKVEVRREAREAFIEPQSEMDPQVRARLRELRGWSDEAISALGLSIEGDRVIFHVTDAEGRPTGTAAYQPNPELRKNAPKNIAQGARELFPAPETIETNSVWLVEGEPDAVAMWTVGLPAVAVPGVATWKPGWVERFERFERVYVCFDCDEQGRQAAALRVSQLARLTKANLVDLSEDRADGYDINDLLLEEGPGTVAKLSGLTVASTPVSKRLDTEGPEVYERPFAEIVEALERLDCRPRGSDHKINARCPAHDDRVASLSMAEGDDGRVLVHCHAGCETDEIVVALGLEMRQLFPKKVG